MAGVSPAAITKACKHQLRPAVVGKTLALDHPAVGAYLRAKGKEAPKAPAGTRAPRNGKRRASAPTARAAKSPNPSPAPTEPRPAPPAGGDFDGLTPEEIAALDDLPLRAICDRYGHIVGFKAYVDARIGIQRWREKKLRNDEADGRLIPVEFVRFHVFEALRDLFSRLLEDSPRTIASQIMGAARAGATLEECEQTVSDQIASQLQPVKDRVERALRSEES